MFCKLFFGKESLHVTNLHAFNIIGFKMSKFGMERYSPFCLIFNSNLDIFNTGAVHGEVIGFVASLPDIISVKPQASSFWRVLFQIFLDKITR